MATSRGKQGRKPIVEENLRELVEEPKSFDADWMQKQQSQQKKSEVKGTVQKAHFDNTVHKGYRGSQNLETDYENVDIDAGQILHNSGQVIRKTKLNIGESESSEVNLVNGTQESGNYGRKSSHDREKRRQDRKKRREDRQKRRQDREKRRQDRKNFVCSGQIFVNGSQNVANCGQTCYNNNVDNNAHKVYICSVSIGDSSEINNYNGNEITSNDDENVYIRPRLNVRKVFPNWSQVLKCSGQ